MSDTINKINKLYLAESFLQLNFNKGYKYVDKAGEIVNHFCDDQVEPKFEMGLGGLALVPPNGVARLIKTSSHHYWSHYVSPDSLDIAITDFTKNVSKVLDILEVEKVSRAGWRSYFIYDCKDEDDRNERLKKFSVDESMDFEEIFFSTKVKEVDLNIRIRKVVRDSEKEGKISVPGILFDIDMYKKDDEKRFSNWKNILKDFSSLYRSKEMLDVLNKLLKI